MRNDLQAAVEHLEAMAQNAIGAAADADMPEQQKTALWAEYKALDTALTALRSPAPDPDTGLVPCGCGGKAKIWLSDFTRFTYLITNYEVGCTECAMTTGWVRGKQESAMNVWNTAMGYTVPPRPGAIGPDAGGMAPNGDEGAES